MSVDYRAQAEEFAAHLVADTSKGQRKRKGDRVEGRCPIPAHEDKHPSFSFTVGIDAYACSCGGGKGSELRSLLGWSNGTNGNKNALPRPNVKALAPMPFTRPPDKIHPYQNGNRKLRWYNPDGSKSIAWEHEVNGQWTSGKVGDTGLYNESQIAESDTVYLSESESDCDALSALGLVSSCHGYGAGVNLKPDQAALFKRKRVPILEHADDAGRKWSAAQLKLLTAAGADAWIVPTPDPHKDIRDYVTAGADKFAVEFLASAFEPKDCLAEESGKLFDRTPDTIDYILEPVLSKGCILQIQGNPKGGKSSFALHLALSCALGRWTSDRFNFVGGPRRTLYLSYEDSARRLKRRARLYLAGMGVTDSFPPSLLLFPRPPDLDLGTDEGRAKLDKIIRQNKVEVLIIDTLSWVAAGDENTKKDMQPVLATIRFICEEYGTAIILIHHTRKTSQGGDVASVSERGRGSSAIAAAADSILDFGSRVSPDHTLCKFISKDADDDEFVVAYKRDPDSGSISWQLEEVTEREDKLKSRSEVLDACKSLSVTDPLIDFERVNKLLPNMSDSTVRNSMRDLIKKGQLSEALEKGPRGKKFYNLKLAT